MFNLYFVVCPQFVWRLPLGMSLGVRQLVPWREKRLRRSAFRCELKDSLWASELLCVYCVVVRVLGDLSLFA